MTVLERTAKWIVDRRAIVQIGIAALSVGCVIAVDDLRFELDPEALVADSADDAARALDVREAFGAPERTLLVVLTGEDVLDSTSLAYQHRIARWLEGRRWTVHVDAITTTPVPHRVPRARPQTLDDVEADPSLLDVALPTGPTAEALTALAASAPERFPDGMTSILEGWGDRPLVVAPLVPGDVPTPAEARRVREVVDDGGLFARAMVAEDHRAALIGATLVAETDLAAQHASHSLVGHLTSGDPPPSGLDAVAGGLPHVRAQLVEALEADWVLLITLACFGSIAMLAMGFRSVAGVVLPMASVGITLAIVTGGMAFFDIPIDLLTNVVPPLLITIGLGDAVHLLTRYREERRDGEAPLPAARRTLSAMAVACFMTSVTTAVGFGSLIISQTGVLRRFGALAAGSVMVAYVITVLFIPSALPAFPGERGVRRSRVHFQTLDLAVKRFSSFGLNHSVGVVTAAALIFAACLIAASGVRVDGALLDQFDGTSDVKQTTRILERELGGVRSFEVGARSRSGSILAPDVLEALDEIADSLRAEDGVLRVTAPGDVLRETWANVTGETSATNVGPNDAFANAARVDALAALTRASRAEGIRSPLDALVAAHGHLGRIEVRLEDRGVRHINGIIDRLEGRLAGVDAFEGFVTGEAYRASRGLRQVVRDLLSSLGLAVLVIFLLIGLLFRSPRLALISVPPNVLPLAVVLAWMRLRGIPLHVATVIVFGVSIGLAVDGTIHILTRYREELRSRDPLGAIRAAMASSGRAVVLSSAALLLGFLALLLSGFVPIRLFGELSVVAVIAALAAELTLLPALVALSSRRGKTR